MRKIVALMRLLRKNLDKQGAYFLAQCASVFHQAPVVHGIRPQRKGDEASGLGDGKAIFYIEVRDEDWITARGH
ncbi:hypothetical protein [Pannonibacter indicus]|uniref:hypothetical protein n=1 Tax=Pannonibacter indicus TaxID=466044 RepID=UPI00391B33B2